MVDHFGKLLFELFQFSIEVVVSFNEILFFPLKLFLALNLLLLDHFGVRDPSQFVELFLLGFKPFSILVQQVILLLLDLVRNLLVHLAYARLYLLQQMFVLLLITHNLLLAIVGADRVERCFPVYAPRHR